MTAWGRVAILGLLVLSGCVYSWSDPPARVDTQCLDEAAGAACDDGNPCTTGDACDGDGRCTGAAVLCATAPSPECHSGDATYRTYQSVGSCSPSTGACEYPFDDVACPNCAAECLNPCDNVECPPLAGGCQVGTCIPGPPRTCDYDPAPNDTACTVGAAAGVCSEGTCLATCSSHADCNDNNPCTDDVCDGIFCAPPTFNTADCGTCSICDGAGLCVYDATQDADCGDEICGFCTGPGECGRADSGTACDVCMVCDNTGLCSVPTPANQSGPQCNDGDTLCSQADHCDGAGTCLPRHRDTSTPCSTCTTCDGQGECALPVSSGQPGMNCNANATSCSAADQCDGAGGCILGHFGAGTDCGICGACNGAGACLYDDTQDADCGNTLTCGSCQSVGVCSFASSSTFCGECSQCNGAGSCNVLGPGARGQCAACDACNGSGACEALSAGSQGGCPTCQQCNAGGACVNRTNGTQAPGCSSNCLTCQGGACTGKEWQCVPHTPESCVSACSQSACQSCCSQVCQ